MPAKRTRKPNDAQADLSRLADANIRAHEAATRAVLAEQAGNKKAFRKAKAEAARQLKICIEIEKRYPPITHPAVKLRQ